MVSTCYLSAVITAYSFFSRLLLQEWLAVLHDPTLYKHIFEMPLASSCGGWRLRMNTLSKPCGTVRCPSLHFSACRRDVSVTRALRVDQDVTKKAVSVLLGAGLALGLTLAPAAEAKNLADQRREQEELILAQKSKLEYAIQLQENARKAELLGKRQTLENQVEQVENVLQQKLLEEKAIQQSAQKKGEEQLAQRIATKEQQIQAQESALQVAAAKAEAQIEQQEIVQEARVVQQKQQVQKASNSLMELLGITEADLGL